MTGSGLFGGSRLGEGANLCLGAADPLEHQACGGRTPKQSG